MNTINNKTIANNNKLYKRQEVKCNRQATRPEIRQLSPQQRSKLFDAIKKLNEGGENSEFNRLAKIHLDYAGEAHGVPAFLPWHRKFLSIYESSLQKIDPEIIIPYWDWSIDSQSPETSVVLSEEFYGVNGDKENNSCLKSGFFKDQTVNTPNSHCLKRDFDGNTKVSAFYSGEALEFVLNQNDFNSFSRRLEGAPHARVHIGLGGNEGDIMTMYSTNDPVFFLHHAFIDLLWNEWQQRHPNANQYDGTSAQGSAVSDNEELKPFNVNVKEALSTQRYCYTYPRYQGSSGGNKNPMQRRALLGSVQSLTKDTSKLANNVVKSALKTVSSILNELNNVNLDAFDRDSKNNNLVREPLVISESYAQKNNMPYSEMLEYQLEIKKEVIDKHNAQYMDINNHSNNSSNDI